MKTSGLITWIVVGLVAIGALFYWATVSGTQYYHPSCGAHRQTVWFAFGGLPLITLRDSVAATRTSEYLVGQNLPRRSDPGWVQCSALHTQITGTAICCGSLPPGAMDLGFSLVESYYMPFLSDTECRGLLRLMLARNQVQVSSELIGTDFLDALDGAEGAQAKRKLLMDKLGPRWKQYIEGGVAAGSSAQAPLE